MREIKAVFVDIEGTLKNIDGSLSEMTEEYLKRLKDADIPVVITSGLPRFITKEISKEVNASKYVISSNGADVYDRENDKVISASYLDKDILNSIFEMCHPEHNVIIGFGDGELSNTYNEYNKNAKIITSDDDLSSLDVLQWHISQKKANIDENFCYFLLKREIIRYADIVSQFVGEELVYKLICSRKLDDLSQIEIRRLTRAIRFVKLQMLKDNILGSFSGKVTLGNQCEDFISYGERNETPWFSVNNFGVSKGSGIINLCTYLDISTNDVLAIGNDYNDLSMQRVAGYFASPIDRKRFVNGSSIISYDRINNGVGEVLKRVYEINTRR